MALKAFELRDGSHALSAFARRSAQTGVIGEARIEMNGWRSQSLLHTFDVTDFTIDDLALYAADRGYKLNALQVAAMAKTVRSSVPIDVVYSYPAKSWVCRLARTEYPEFTMPDLKGLAEEVRALRTGSNPLNINWYSIGNDPGWKKMGLGSYNTDLSIKDLREFLNFHGHAIVRESDIERVVDLRSWTERKLAAAGVPMVLFGFETVFGGTTANTADADSFVRGLARADCTTIVGPMGWNGVRGVWRGPRMVGNNLFVLDSLVYFGGYSQTNGELRVTIGSKSSVTLVDAEFKAKLKPPSLPANTSGYRSTGTGSVYIATEVTTGTFTFPDVSTSIALPNAAFQPVTVAGLVRKDFRRDLKWKIALPFGFKEVLMASSIGSTSAGDYPVVSLRPSTLGLCTTMEPLRDFVSVQKLNKDLTAAERNQFVEAEKRLATQLDAIVRMTVSSVDISYPTVKDIEKLTLVRDGKKGDVDVLNEDLGKGVTLMAAAKECEKRRIKGERVFAVARIVDEAATRDDLLSPVVLSRSDITLWSLKGVKVGADWLLTGIYDGGTVTSLSAIEFAFLRSCGAVFAPDSAISDEAISTDLGMGPDFKTELSQIGTDALSSAVMSQSWLRPSVDKYALAHADFIGAEGYPVMGYADVDAVNRLILVYKGLGDDPTNMLLGMFFANLLDIEPIVV